MLHNEDNITCALKSTGYFYKSVNICIFCKVSISLPTTYYHKLHLYHTAGKLFKSPIGYVDSNDIPYVICQFL